MIERDYVRYALEHYQSPIFSTEEFTEDLKKVVSLKKLLRRYTNEGVINERLVLNIIIMIINQFGVKAANTILFYKVEKEHHSALKTFLMYLNSYMETDYCCDQHPMDKYIIDKLQEISCRSCFN